MSQAIRDLHTQAQSQETWNTSLTIDDIKKLLDEKLDEKLGPLARGLKNLEDDVARMDRSVKAIESFPVPYGRPRTYHSATELQSVAKPLRRRQSYMG